MPQENKFKDWVLVCQGGGGKGAWEAGFIYETVNSFGLDFKTCLGTSVGAINCALYLQSLSSDLFKNILLETWSKMSSTEIFGLPSLKGLGRFGISDSSKLHNLIIKNIRKSDIESVCILQKKYLVILATNFRNCKMWVWHPFIFGPHNSTTKTSRDSFYSLHAALIASASIPFIYPYIQQDMMTLYDGGIVENNPIKYAEVGCSNVLVLSPNWEDNKSSLLKRLYFFINPFRFLENQVLRRVCEVKNDINYRRIQSNKMYRDIPVTNYYFVRPSQKIPSGTLCFSKKNSIDSFKIGQKDAKDFMNSLLNDSNLLSKYNLEILNIPSPTKNFYEWFFLKVLKIKTISG